MVKRKAEMFEKNKAPMSLEQYNNKIDQAMDDSKNGRMIKAIDLKGDVRFEVSLCLSYARMD